MHFTSTLSALLLAFASAARASVIARVEGAQPIIVLYDLDGLQGESYNPDVQLGKCKTLPPQWFNRAESARISNDHVCVLFPGTECQGPRTPVSGTVYRLPPPVDNKAKSLICYKLED